MAATVIANLTTLFEGLSGEAADWSGTDGISTEVFQQGVSSEGWIVAKNGNETGIYDYLAANGSGYTIVTDDHLYLHMRCDVAPFIDYLHIGVSSTAAGTTNYEDWTVVDNTTTIEWYGEWKTFIIDLNSTPDRTNGTFTGVINAIRVNVDNSNSGNIRSIENTYLDVCRVGTGLTAYGSTAFDWDDIWVEDAKAANLYKIIEKVGGVYFVRGRIILGDDTGTNACNFVSSDETVVFLDPSTSGEQIGSTLYQLNFVGNSTGSTTITSGTKVGTGDTASGRNGMTIQGESSNVVCSVDMDDGNVNGVDLYGVNFRNLGGVIDATGLVAADEIMGGSIDGCDQFSAGAATVRNLTVLNSTSISTLGAVLWENGTTDMKNSSFIANTNAFEVRTLSADMTFVGMEFAGNTNDVRYEGATDWDLNWSQASGAPSISNAGAGTLSPVNSVNTTIVGVPTSAEWRLYVDSGVAGELGTTELDGAESHTGGNITYADNYSSDTNVVLQVLADGFVEYQLYFPLISTAQTITVVLTPETNE